MYRTSCLSCRERGKESSYFGESGRTSFERGLEHARDYATMQEDSHMYSHYLDEHSQEERRNVKFEMKVLRGHFSAVSRQVHEAVAIRSNAKSGINILNSKYEYSRCVLPTLSVKMGERDVKEKVEERRYLAEMSELQEEREIDNSRNKKREIEIAGQPLGKRRRIWKIGNSTTKRKREDQEEGDESVQMSGRMSTDSQECRPHKITRKVSDANTSCDNSLILNSNSENGGKKKMKQPNLKAFFDLEDQPNQFKSKTNYFQPEVDQVGEKCSRAKTEIQSTPSSSKAKSSLSQLGRSKPKSKGLIPPKNYAYKSINFHFKSVTLSDRNYDPANT